MKTHDERVKEAVISRLKSEKNCLGLERQMLSMWHGDELDDIPRYSELWRLIKAKEKEITDAENGNFKKYEGFRGESQQFFKDEL